MPPTYPEYPQLWEQARRAAHGFVDPTHIRRLEEITHRRGADWCTAVLGRPFVGLRRVSVAEAELLRLAHERGLDPPLPDEIVAARQAAADHRAMIAQQRRQRAEQDRREWTEALGQAAVPAEVLPVRANVRGEGRSSHRGGGPLHHVVPTVDLWSGPETRRRRHPAGRALCETEHRAKPLQLGEPTGEPATCVRCLAWTTRVRTSPTVGAGRLGTVADPGQRAPDGHGAVLPGTLDAPVADPDAVVAAARLATARHRGNPIRGHHVLNAAVWVDLTSWPRAQQAATYLDQLGYQVSAGPSPDGYGWSVTVSGWNAESLTKRGLELNRAVRELELHQRDVADEAIDRFQGFLRQGLGEDAACQQAAANLPPTPQAPAVLGPDVSEHDLSLSPPEHREALARVAASRHAWRTLVSTNVAEAAIGTYLECRQMRGHHVDRARAEAVADVTRRSLPAYDPARFTREARHEGGHEHGRSGHRRPTPGGLDTPSARHAIGTPPQGSRTGGPGTQPPTTRAAVPHHRSR